MCKDCAARYHTDEMSMYNGMSLGGNTESSMYNGMTVSPIAINPNRYDRNDLEKAVGYS